LVVKFDSAFAARTAEDFVSQLAAAARPLAGICIGEGWRFGHRRLGDADLLRCIGSGKNFFTREVAPVRIDGAVVSSTLIRQALAEGRLAAAARLLGRDYSIAGVVIRGAELGRTIGFPTANIATDFLQLPADGVYAVEVLLEGREISGIANLGVRPTVAENSPRLLEVHLFDFSSDLYGRDIEVRFRKFLRPEKKFASLDELRAGIARDIETAREHLAT
jgi:riboflavin kinase/FMN adenylyltransferase